MPNFSLLRWLCSTLSISEPNFSDNAPSFLTYKNAISAVCNSLLRCFPFFFIYPILYSFLTQGYKKVRQKVAEVKEVKYGRKKWKRCRISNYIRKVSLKFTKMCQSCIVLHDHREQEVVANQSVDVSERCKQGNW